MSAASDFLENALLNHTLGGAVYNQPANLYIGLFLNVSTNAAANLEAGILTDEVSGGSYTREIMTFAAASGGAASNNATVTFPTATATWGNITHVAIMDTAVAGNVLFYGAVTVAKEILNGDTFQSSTGNLTISLA
jgi:hypothetical protein